MISRYGLKALGLCALLLGAMAVVASGAQAAEWDVAGAASKELNPTLESPLEAEKPIALLATINNLDMELSCTLKTLIGLSLNVFGHVLNLSLKYENCEGKIADLSPPGTYNGTKLATACEPHSNGKAAGTIETREGSATLELHTGSVPVVLIKPNNAEEEFVNIEMGEECAFGANVPVFGVFAIQDTNGKAEVEEAKHTISELKALTKLFLVKNKTGPTGTIDGSALVFLGGTHANKNWRALAG